MTAGKALGVNDHREMARGSQREFKVQGGVREGGRNTVKENGTWVRLVQKKVLLRTDQPCILVYHWPPKKGKKKKQKHKIVFWMKIASGISFFRLTAWKKITNF